MGGKNLVSTWESPTSSLPEFIFLSSLEWIIERNYRQIYGVSGRRSDDRQFESLGIVILTILKWLKVEVKRETESFKKKTTDQRKYDQS